MIQWWRVLNTVNSEGISWVCMESALLLLEGGVGPRRGAEKEERTCWGSILQAA
jgi:hypothetical protein